jgi:DNA-binding IclR family transcriptional regulator
MSCSITFSTSEHHFPQGMVGDLPPVATGEWPRYSNPSTTTAPATQSVPALERTLKILELLAESRVGLTLPEIAEMTGFPKSSVHCIMVTLQRSKYVHRNPRSGRYLFGIRLVWLADTALNGLIVRDYASPILFRLMQQTRLTVHMAVLVHGEALLVSRNEPFGVPRVATRVGQRLEVHCTGVGKALIAYLHEHELDILLKSRGFPRHNENTITSMKKLKEDLERTRKRGYAIDDEEDQIGLRSVGVPVFGSHGAVIAAISVAGTTEQIIAENLEELAARLHHASLGISRAIMFNETS